eukprot:10284455-Alexandrium_andersonii.AAC.1
MQMTRGRKPAAWQAASPRRPLQRARCDPRRCTRAPSTGATSASPTRSATLAPSGRLLAPIVARSRLAAPSFAKCLWAHRQRKRRNPAEAA